MKTLQQSLNESFIHDTALLPKWCTLLSGEIKISDFDCNILIDILNFAEKYHDVKITTKSSDSVSLHKIMDFISEMLEKYSIANNTHIIKLSLIAKLIDYYAKMCDDILFIADICPYLGRPNLFVNNRISVFIDSKGYDKPVGCTIYNSTVLCGDYIYLEKLDLNSIRKSFVSIFGNNAKYINNINS